jgi:hypothetical protein
MAAPDAFIRKLEARIRDVLREEFVYTPTSVVNGGRARLRKVCCQQYEVLVSLVPNQSHNFQGPLNH